jgi:hypothetical protein
MARSRGHIQQVPKKQKAWESTDVPVLAAGVGFPLISAVPSKPEAVGRMSKPWMPARAAMTDAAVMSRSAPGGLRNRSQSAHAHVQTGPWVQDWTSTGI